MRIIGGSRRGTILTKLDAVNTRPTAERVRESLFNILQGGRFRQLLIDCHVVDLFAGTGALGLEAVSRGAAFASFIEIIAKHWQYCTPILPSYGFSHQPLFWLSMPYHRRTGRSKPAQLVFADAPYQSGDGLIAVVKRPTTLVRWPMVRSSWWKLERPKR